MAAEQEKGEEIVLRVKRLNADATLPQRQSPGAAGYDLFSAEDCVVEARGKQLVHTKLAIELPQGFSSLAFFPPISFPIAHLFLWHPGTYGRIAPRSSLAWKGFIDVGAGVIDGDYRGEVGVVLFNHSEKYFAIAKGDRVAQLILERILTPPVLEVTELSDSDRGEGGYGSTGK